MIKINVAFNESYYYLIEVYCHTLSQLTILSPHLTRSRWGYRTLVSCGTRHQATKKVLISHLDESYHYIDWILTNILYLANSWGLSSASAYFVKKKRLKISFINITKSHLLCQIKPRLTKNQFHKNKYCLCRRMTRHT